MALSYLACLQDEICFETNSDGGRSGPFSLSHSGLSPAGPLSLKQSIIFLSISLNMSIWCSKEPTQQDCSFEHLQHVFYLRN